MLTILENENKIEEKTIENENELKNENDGKKIEESGESFLVNPDQQTSDLSYSLDQDINIKNLMLNLDNSGFWETFPNQYIPPPTSNVTLSSRFSNVTEYNPKEYEITSEELFAKMISSRTAFMKMLLIDLTLYSHFSICGAQAFPAIKLACLGLKNCEDDIEIRLKLHDACCQVFEDQWDRKDESTIVIFDDNGPERYTKNFAEICRICMWGTEVFILKGGIFAFMKKYPILCFSDDAIEEEEEEEDFDDYYLNDQFTNDLLPNDNGALGIELSSFGIDEKLLNDSSMLIENEGENKNSSNENSNENIGKTEINSSNYIDINLDGITNESNSNSIVVNNDESKYVTIKNIEDKCNEIDLNKEAIENTIVANSEKKEEQTLQLDPSDKKRKREIINGEEAKRSNEAMDTTTSTTMENIQISEDSNLINTLPVFNTTATYSTSTITNFENNTSITTTPSSIPLPTSSLTSESKELTTTTTTPTTTTTTSLNNINDNNENNMEETNNSTMKSNGNIIEKLPESTSNNNENEKMIDGGSLEIDQDHSTKVVTDTMQCRDPRQMPTVNIESSILPSVNDNQFEDIVNLRKVQKNLVHNVWYAMDDSEDIPHMVCPPFLFLGSLYTSQERHLLAYNIKHIIRLGSDFNITYSDPSKFEFHNFDIFDLPREPIQQLFQKANEIIEQARLKKENVLVHCHAGVSRSSTIILAYLMKYKGMSLYDAWCSTFKIRPIIRPNDGFAKALQEYEKFLFNCKESTMPVVGMSNSYLFSIEYFDFLSRLNSIHKIDPSVPVFKPSKTYADLVEEVRKEEEEEEKKKEEEKNNEKMDIVEKDNDIEMGEAKNETKNNESATISMEYSITKMDKFSNNDVLQQQQQQQQQQNNTDIEKNEILKTREE